MFGKNSQGKDTGSAAMETVIGAETVLQGTISSKGSLRIDGKVEGGITDANSVVIGESGEVNGDINARSVVVGGKVVGNIASTSIEILSDSQITGDIKTATLAIAEGASFEGNCTMIREKQVIEMDMSARARK